MPGELRFSTVANGDRNPGSSVPLPCALTRKYSTGSKLGTCVAHTVCFNSQRDHSSLPGSQTIVSYISLVLFFCFRKKGKYVLTFHIGKEPEVCFLYYYMIFTLFFFNFQLLCAMIVELLF